MIEIKNNEFYQLSAQEITVRLSPLTGNPAVQVDYTISLESGMTAATGKLRALESSEKVSDLAAELVAAVEEFLAETFGVRTETKEVDDIPRGLVDVEI